MLEINGERIDASHTLASLIQKYHVGDQVTLKLLRGGEDIEAKVTLEERK